MDLIDSISSIINPNLRFIPPLITIIVVSLACTIVPEISSESTPESFPLPGVIQTTFDDAFYKDLSWSPSGRYISSTRCPVVSGEPKCIQFSESILIDLDTKETIAIDISSITKNDATSTSFFWTNDGEKVLLSVSEKPDKDLESEEHKSRFFFYSTLTSEFEDIDIPGTPIAISDDNNRIFLLFGIDEHTLAYGWLNLDDGSVDEDYRFDLEKLPTGPYTLSPENNHLLISDSLGYDDCNQILIYELGSHLKPALFLDMACYPAWSPKGQKIAYSSITEIGDFRPQIMVADEDGLNSRLLFEERLPLAMVSPTWSPDGEQIAFTYGFKSNAVFIADNP